MMVCLLLMRPRLFEIFEVFISYLKDRPMSTHPVYSSSYLCNKVALLIKYTLTPDFPRFIGTWVPFANTNPILLKRVFPNKKLKSVSRPFSFILS